MSPDVNAPFSSKLGKPNGTLLNERLIQAKLYAPPQISSATIGADTDALLIHCGDTQEDISALLKLADSYLMHCKREGVDDGLDAAIALQCEALRVAHTLNLRSRMIDICLSISESLTEFFGRDVAKDDVEDAVKIGQLAQSISPRSDSRILARLGRALGLLHKRSHKAEDIRGAIAALRQAVDHEDQDLLADGKVNALTDLSYSLQDLFHVTGELADLQESIAVARRAVSTPCTTFPQHTSALTSLGSSLQQMFVTGVHPIHMLEEAVASCRLSVRCSPLHHPQSAANLLTLAAALGVRHAALGNITDLDEVSTLLDDALRVNKSSRMMTSILSNLGLVKFRLCEAREDYSNIMESVQLLRKTLQYRPTGDPQRVFAVTNLISALLLAHKGGHSGSLDEAVALAREVMDVYGSSHPYACTILLDLCQVLRARGSVADLNEAMPLHKQLLELLPMGFRGNVDAKADWALSLVARFKLTRNIDDVNEAVRLIDEAIDNRYSPIVGYRAAWDWVTTTTDLPSIDPSLSYISLAAHRKAISLLPRVSYLGFDPHARLNALKQGRQLAVDAAILALSQNKPVDAVELLEQGRSIFWTGSLRPRAEYHTLPEPLSSKMSETYKALEALGQHPPGDDGDVRRRAYANKLEDLIAEARALPGHADFLLPRSFSALKAVSTEGPVVILVGNTVIGEAIVLLDEDTPPCRVVLSNIDQRRLERTSRALGHAKAVARDREANYGAPQNHQVSDEETNVREQLDIVDQVETLDVASSAERVERLKLHRDRHTQHDIHSFLRRLWDDIMGPVLASIGSQTPTASPSRMWLCPTGTFMFLPLHAAQSPSGYYALDCAVISYIPTLTTLLNARERIHAVSELVDPKVLVVAQPNVPSQVALPQTLDEAAVVQALVPLPNLISISDAGVRDDIVNMNVDVNCSRVVESLSEVSVLHLACHGFQEASRPLDSGFMMHDKRLTVSDLMALKLPKAQFAFLSACQSAMGDRDSPDEAIHLSAAMMFLGFGSVVATMWSMNDSDGPSLAREIYGGLFDGNRLDLASIPRALNRAVRNLRDAGVHPSRWATYIHMGA